MLRQGAAVYGYSVDVAMSSADYDRLHAEILGSMGELGEPCLLHLVTRTDTGCRITEVWETQEAADRFADEVVGPVLVRLFGAEAAAAGPPPRTELEVHNLQVGRRAEAMT